MREIFSEFAGPNEVTHREHLAWCALLAALATWAFWVSADAQWIYEDRAHVRVTGELVAGPRLLTDASWYVLQKIAPGPQAARWANLLLHGIVAALVWQLARRIGVSSLGAYLTAGLVLLHPLAVETVSYPAQRGELFAAIGVLTACLCAAGTWWRWPTALVLIGAVGFGLLGKESAVVALGLVPLTLWVKGRL